MKSSCYLMTGSHVPRRSRSGSKRRCLDAEVPMAVPPEEEPFEDEDDDDDGDEEEVEEWVEDVGVVLGHRRDQTVGPFGTSHDAVLGGEGVHQGDDPATLSGMPSASWRSSGRRGDVCKDWWPLVWSVPGSVQRGAAAPRASSAPTATSFPHPHRTAVQGSSSSTSRTSARKAIAPGAVAPRTSRAARSRRATRAHQDREQGALECAQPGQAHGGDYQESAPTENQREQGWSQLPAELLVGVFELLRLQDLGRCAQVCRAWRRASQAPCLWRTAEFVLGSSLRPEPTPPALVNFILEEHAQHLKFVVLRTDSSAESARGACRILARLVKCSLKTLALMSGVARPPLVDVDRAADEQRFASALTLVLDHSSPSLRALALDNSLVDDPALQALAGVGSSATGCGSLQLLRCKSCPRLSPGGVLALVDHCRCLRELSLSYTLLSDDLLNALSSERHVCLEVLRVDVYTDADTALRPIAPSSWRTLVAHSPQLNLVMYLFAIRDESFDSLFTSYIPVTHLYFGDYVPTSVLGRVGAYCPRLVELVVGANGNSVIDSQLLDIAANCGQLSSLGLAECQVTCSALVHLAELCGPRLSQLVVMEECLVEDGVHDLASACASVSRILGRDWNPEFMPMW